MLLWSFANSKILSDFNGDLSGANIATSGAVRAPRLPAGRYSTFVIFE